MTDVAPKLIPELKVQDFPKSLAFYTNLAEFKVLYDRPEEQFAMLEKEGAQLMIEALTSASKSMVVGDLEYPLGRGMHFQIEVTDVETLYSNFKKNGYPIFSELEEKWYQTGNIEGGNRQFYVQDPDGYMLRFFQDLGER